MGLFDFLKKKTESKAPISQPPSQNTASPIPVTIQLGPKDETPEVSIDDELKYVTDKYAVLEEKRFIKTAVCPHCNVELEKMPGRKRNCPHCGSLILVRTSPVTHDKVLLSEKMQQRQSVHGRNIVILSGG